MLLDGPAVRQRLVQIITERAERDGHLKLTKRDGRVAGRIQRALARTVREGDLKWNTVWKKLTGKRGMTEDDVRRIAAAFGENPEWLASGQGLHGDEWIRAHFEAVAQRQGIPFPPRGDHAVATPQAGTPRLRGRPRKVLLGPRVTGESARRSRPRWKFDDVPRDPAEREKCVQWLARTPDVLDAWIGRELDRESPRRTTLQALLEAAKRAVQEAGDKDVATNRRALVREVTNALRHFGAQ